MRIPTITTVRLLSLLPGLLLPMNISAQSIEELLHGARERSPILRSRESAVEQARYRLLAVTEEDFLTYSVGSGETQVTFPGENSTTLEVAPGATVQLAEPWATQANISLGTTFTFGEETSTDLAPSFTVTQPLTELLFELPEDATHRERMNALVQAQIALLTEEMRLREEVYGAVHTVVQRSHELPAAERDLELAQAEVTEARELGTYEESSARFQNLLSEVRLAEQDVAHAERMLDLQRDRIEHLTGVRPEGRTPAELPETPRWRESPSLQSVDLDALLSVHQAQLSLELERLRYTNEFGELPPTLAVSGRIATRETATRETLTGSTEGGNAGGGAGSEPVTDYELSVTSDWENLSLSAGAGVTPGSDTFYARGELRWSPGTPKASSFSRAGQEESIRQAELAVESARRTALDGLAALESQFAAQENQRLQLEERLAYARLNLEETRARNERGLVEAEAVEQAVWSVTTIEREQDLLRWSRLITLAEFERKAMEADERL